MHITHIMHNSGHGETCVVLFSFYLAHVQATGQLNVTFKREYGTFRATPLTVVSYLVIPVFVIQFITTRVKVWCTLNHLLVTRIKMVWSHIVVYCMTYKERLIIIYSFWCKYAVIWYSTIIYTRTEQNFIYTQAVIYGIWGYLQWAFHIIILTRCWIYNSI